MVDAQGRSAEGLTRSRRTWLRVSVIIQEDSWWGEAGPVNDAGYGDRADACGSQAGM